ncbi:hypothetical protein V8C42DRAFT_315002 [Trichoderma barbatum]
MITNVYTLGSIRGHNIVMACLPKGRYGTNSAATIATKMIGSFPSIKFGLIVSIGDGIPSKVRLMMSWSARHLISIQESSNGF